MQQYLDLLSHVLENGSRKNDRTGTGTISVFGYQMRFDLGKGFPVLTTKKLHLRSIIQELLWFLKGDAHIYLNHIEQCRLQLIRDPRPLPEMKINPEIRDLSDFKFEDFKLVGYNPHPHIKGVISV